MEIAAVPPGNTGGFAVGDLFSGNGQPGQVVHISADGSVVQNPWVTLPGETGLLRGALYVDQTGVWGDDLILSTTAGDIWKVDSKGDATEVAANIGAGQGAYFEGVITVPNDPDTYGPLAGTIVTTDENNGPVYAIDTSGHVTKYALGIDSMEDVTLISPAANFYGVDNGSNEILGARGSDFAPYAGQILVTQEIPETASGLWRIYWDGSQLRTQAIPLAQGSAPVRQWEHVNFAPVGVNPLPPPPATLSSLSGSAYVDANNDGAFNPGEPPLGGVTVTLTGTRSQGGAVAATTTTASNGSFTFTDLWPGTYTLTETPPAGSINAKETVGSLGGTAVDRSFANIRLLGGQDGTGYLFGHERAPTFTTTPPTTASVPSYPSKNYLGNEVEYQYQAGATDPDRDALTYSLLRGPSGMAVDPHTGLVTWMPPLVGSSGGSGGSGGGSSSTDGDYNVALLVADGRGGTAEQDYVLKVIQQAPDMPPVWTSTPVVDASVASPYTYQGTAQDVDLDNLTFSVVAGPPNLAIDPNSGLVTWTPTEAQLGPNAVTLKVADNAGNAALQQYTIMVGQAAGNLPPRITSAPVLSVPAGQTYIYPVTAVDDDKDAPLNWHLAVAPGAMAIGAQGGRIAWATTGADIGQHAVHVIVDDGRGGTDEQDFTVNVTTLNEVRGRVYEDPNPVPLPPVGTPPVPAPITLLPVNTPWTDMTAPQYDPISGDLIVSVNYGASGVPNVFNRIGPDGTQVPFSSAAGYADEVELATVRAGNPGGFQTGDVFAGNGQPGQIVRITPGGDITNPWVTLPNETGLLRGALYVDRTGLWGGDLIVVTTTGDVWTVTAAGVPKLLAAVSSPGTHSAPTLEGVVTVPNDPANYGPLAGMIVVSSESDGGVYTIDAQGNSTYYNLGISLPETIDLIPADENFYGVAEGTHTLLAAPAADFAGMAGQLLITQETASPNVNSGMWRVYWDGATLRAAAITLTAASAAPQKWEHVTFAPAGIDPIQPTPGGPGLPDWTINLLNSSNQVVATTTTGPDGTYAFRDVANGTYTVAEVPQAGWTEVLPAAGTYAVTLTGGQVALGDDFDDVQATGPNQPPTFTTNPVTSAQVGVKYAYDAWATDPDRERLAYDLPVHPAGMVVDPLDGVVAWTPTPGEVGPQAVLLRAQDGRGGVVLQSFTVTVAAANVPPAITSKPTTTALAGLTYTYQIRAEDPDGDTITYHLNQYPANMTVSATGLVSWPNAALGTAHVVVQATDAYGLIATQPFDLMIVNQGGNDSPVFSSTPRGSIQLGRTYLYQPVAVDDDHDPVTYTLGSNPPAGVTISATGLVSWQPTPAEFGTDTFTVQAGDGRGGVTNQTVTVNVVAQQVNHPPTITSTPGPFATVGHAYEYDATATDADGDPLAWSLVAGPTGMAIDPVSGVVLWTPTADELGTQAVTVRVDDGQGGYATQDYSVVAHGAPLPPQIVSTPDTRAAQGKDYQYQVVAVDPQGDPLAYTLTNPPTGMSINATGLLDWPNPTPTGNQAVAITVTDSEGAVATQNDTLVVGTTTIDQPPVITSKPAVDAVVGTQYQYAVVATSPIGLGLTYSLQGSPPQGMQINQSTGLVTWTPQAATTATVTVQAQDTAGGFASQSYTLTAAANTAPTVAAIPNQAATVGAPFSYLVSASDGDGDAPLTYTLTGPTGMAVDAAGQITWTPQPGDVGTKNVTVTATDPFGLTSAPQSFAIAVSADTIPPAVQVQEDANPANKGTVVTFLVTTQDAVPVTALSLTVGGTAVALDAHGAGRLLMPTVGNFTVTATATDAGGQTGTATDTLAVVDPTDTSAPTATITTPGNQVTITAPTAVVGTAKDAVQLNSWTLEVAPVAGGLWTTIASGTTAVTDGTLGTFDPTMLADGSYNLRLTARNSGGHVAVAEEVVTVAGHLKLGNLHASFTDLTIPVAGIPITITRTYDTLNAGRQGDFGPGWTLDEGDFRLQVSQPDGTLMDLGVNAPLQKGARLILTRPGQDPEGFTFEPQPVTTGYFTTQYFTPFYVPDAEEEKGSGKKKRGQEPILEEEKRRKGVRSRSWKKKRGQEPILIRCEVAAS